LHVASAFAAHTQHCPPLLPLVASLPLLQVEATKFTEVGYHGKDVDSMWVGAGG